MTDTDGEEVWKGDYMPFGEDIAEQINWGNAYTFLGNEDDGGLSFFNARYYSPELGRFMSCDPIKLMGSTLSINPYVYSYNNPISYSDASGLIAGKQSSKYGKGTGRLDDPSDFSNFTGVIAGQVEILAEKIAETYDETVNLFYPDVPNDNGLGGYDSAFADAKANSNLAEFAGKVTNSTNEEIEDIMEGIIRKKAKEKENGPPIWENNVDRISIGSNASWMDPTGRLDVCFDEDGEVTYDAKGDLGKYSLFRRLRKGDWRNAQISPTGRSFYGEVAFGNCTDTTFSISCLNFQYTKYTDGNSYGLGVDALDLIPAIGAFPTGSISFGAISDFYNSFGGRVKSDLCSIPENSDSYSRKKK